MTVVRRRCGLGDVADDLRRRDPPGQERERHRRVVAMLDFEPGPVDRPAVEPRRRAGLEPPQRKPARRKRPRQPERRRLADPAGRDLLRADMDEAAEKRAGGQHHPAGGDLAPVAETTPPTWPRASNSRSSAAPSTIVEARRLGEQRRHRLAVELAVGLGARPPHRRPLAAVQHAELDAGAVDRPAHDAVERVDLAHQMALGEPADRRVARHLADRRAAVRQQRRARADPRRRGRRLTAGMAAADHDDVVFRAGLAHGGGM